jgi:hypothetical protein
MVKSILSFTIAVALLSSPAVLKAEPMVEITETMEADFSGITVSVEQSMLHVTGASGQVMQVYNVAGVCVATVKVDGDDKRYDLNLAKGCYIVKVGKVVRKVSIR